MGQSMREEIIVVGDSGHAKVCIELLRSMGQPIAYCVGNSANSECLGIPVLQGDEHLEKLRKEGYGKSFIAVGNNALRRRLAKMVQSLGYQLTNAISPQAIISPTARLGTGIAIMSGAVINAAAIIQDLSIINTGACVDHDCVIGEAAHIAPTCGLAGNVTVGEESFLGIGCKVIPGITIGKAVILGAGSVVIRDMPNGVKAVGVPAKILSR